MVRVKTPIRHYHVVHEEDAHDVASRLDLLCQHIIRLAWLRRVRWVIVGDCKDGGIVQNRLPHHSSYVHRCLRDTSYTELHMLDEPKVLVHQEKMRLLHVQVSHLGVDEIVNRQAAAKVWTLLHLFKMVTLAKLDGCMKSDSLAIPDALNHLQVLHPSLGYIVNILIHHIV